MTKKRYAGIDEDGKLHVTGLEMRRADYVPIAQHIQEQLLMMILRDDCSESYFNEFLANVHKLLPNHPITDFVFEKIVDTRVEMENKTKIVKAWEACGYKVQVSEYEKDGKIKKKYQCLSSRGEALLGIRWIYDRKGLPIGISDNIPIENYKNRIGYNWYWDNQILPIAKRIAASLGWHIGNRQTTLI